MILVTIWFILLILCPLIPEEVRRGGGEVRSTKKRFLSTWEPSQGEEVPPHPTRPPQGVSMWLSKVPGPRFQSVPVWEHTCDGNSGGCDLYQILHATFTSCACVGSLSISRVLNPCPALPLSWYSGPDSKGVGKPCDAMDWTWNLYMQNMLSPLSHLSSSSEVNGIPVCLGRWPLG